MNYKTINCVYLISIKNSLLVLLVLLMVGTAQANDNQANDNKDNLFLECIHEFVDKTPPKFVGWHSDEMTRSLSFLCFDGFATLYSGVSRTPFWSASHLTKRRVQDAKNLIRTDNFHEESRLSTQEQAYLKDYQNSGLDRGHLAPNADMANIFQQYASFSLANIAPQNSEHNRALWKQVESDVRQLAVLYDEVYVVTGVLFLNPTVERLAGRIMIPSHFYKAIYLPKLHQAGVYFSPNNASGDYQILSLSEFHQITGIQLMPTLSKSIQDAVYIPPDFQAKEEATIVLDDKMSGWLHLFYRLYRQFLSWFLVRA